MGSPSRTPVEPEGRGARGDARPTGETRRRKPRTRTFTGPLPTVEESQVPSRPTVKTRAGVEIPWIVYGTAWKKERTAGLVEQAVLAGFRAIDTACQPRHYREAGVGEALLR
jgi:hypothetical protein